MRMSRELGGWETQVWRGTNATIGKAWGAGDKVCEASQGWTELDTWHYRGWQLSWHLCFQRSLWEWWSLLPSPGPYDLVTQPIKFTFLKFMSLPRNWLEEQPLLFACQESIVYSRSHKGKKIQISTAGCPIKFSVMMEMFHTCPIQYGSH